MVVAVSDQPYCRQIAEHEPLHGTAPEGVQRWLLVEDADPWGPKPPRDSALPEAVKGWLAARSSEPGVRVQLIRCGESRRRGEAGRGTQPRQVFVVDAGVEAKARRILGARLELDAIPDLRLDDPSLSAHGFEPVTGPLWLVCTHGKRDRCCAKWGAKLWERMRARVDAPARVWQSSHLGGHRFAPVAAALPTGLMWGRVELDEVDTLVEGIAAGQVPLLPKLRGRCCHSRPFQAAEALLRQREGLDEDDALSLAPEGDLVTYATPAGTGQTTIRRTPGRPTLASCGDEALQPRAHFELAPA